MLFQLLPLALLSLGLAQSANKNGLSRLEEALYKGYDEVWPFSVQFPAVSDLRVKRTDLYEGIANLGQWSEYSLGKILEKALDKKKIKILVVGESITLGANLGCHNNKRTYHYGLTRWWLRTIVNATGSKLARHQIAVGGVGTNYFDRCWKEYLNANETFDLVLWEFAFNDAQAVNQSKAIERFTRSVAGLPEIPGLIFISFFRKSFFESYTSRKSVNPCDKIVDDISKKHESHELTIKTVAEYYGITLLDLERTVCSALEGNSSALSMQHMFNRDHPSFLAHAQMTFILIHYMRATFANIVRKLKFSIQRESNMSNITRFRFKRKLQHFSKRSKTIKLDGSAKSASKHHKKILLPSIFLTKEEADVYDEPICWTAVLPNIHKKPKHDLFDLQIKHSKSFMRLKKTDWRDADEKRYDSTGGFYTTKANQTISFDFTIPKVEEKSKWQISVAIRNKFFGGDVQLSLRNHVNRRDTDREEQEATDVIDSSVKVYSGVNVFDILRKTDPGKKTLTIRTLTGGVHICGIIIS
ncbi:uncharacterized protein LOC135692317 [Rhopilema esculentum]|uniref:uncharacterized protein LOC135692317 n=1 Tax=Rhopilema esculentum TaxID=499914 RepID=UPI0031DAE668|eukprot:gene9135-16797_t